MKGWKETYTNIVLSEQPNQRKLLRVARDLDKAIDKTGDLIKQIPEEMEMINGDYSEAYQELNSGQNSLEYGIRHLEGDIRDYFKEEVKEQINELTVTFRNKNDDHGVSSAEKKGSEFNRKQEQKHIETLLKMINKMDSIQKRKMQYNNSVYGPPSKFSDALMAAESALLDYHFEIEKGTYDGKVEVERIEED